LKRGDDGPATIGARLCGGAQTRPPNRREVDAAVVRRVAAGSIEAVMLRENDLPKAPAWRQRQRRPVVSDCTGASSDPLPMRSYSAITWAPSSNRVAASSRLSSTAMAVVSEP